MKKSRGVISEKERLSLLVKKIAKQCKSLSQLADKLESNNIKPYFRNHKLTGVWMGKRKLRLTTLGIDKSYLQVLTLEQKRLDTLKSKSHNHNNELEL